MARGRHERGIVVHTIVETGTGMFFGESHVSKYDVFRRSITLKSTGAG